MPRLLSRDSFMIMSGGHIADLLACCVGGLDKQDGIGSKIQSLRENGPPRSVELVVETISSVRRIVDDRQRLKDVYIELLTNVLDIQSVMQYLLEKLKALNVWKGHDDPDVESKNENFCHLVALYSDIFCASSFHTEITVTTDNLESAMQIVKMVLGNCLLPLIVDDPEKNRKGIACYRSQMKPLVDLAFCTFKLVSGLSATHSHDTKRQLVQNTAPVLLIVCGVNWRRHEWTNPSSIDSIHELAELFVQLLDVSSIDELLCGQSGKSRGCLGEVLKLLRPYFREEVIVHAQMAISALHWCLQRVHHPCVGPHLPSLTPPLLLMVDIYDSKIKATGLKCISKVISEVDPSELRLHDRAEVIYAALKPQIYSNDPRVLRHLYPPLLGVIQVLEPLPQRMRQVTKRGRLDDVFSLVLSSALCEGKIALRRAHVSYFHQFVSAMGIGTCKHLKRLLDVIFDYLGFPDVDLEETRLSAVRTLEVVIQQTWPRMPLHAADIAKRLIKLIVDCSKSQTTIAEMKQELTADEVTVDYFQDFTDSDAHSGLLLGSCKCLVLLLRCGGDKLKGELETVRDLNNHTAVTYVLNTALQLL